MKKYAFVVLLPVLAGIAFPASADMFAPSPSCRKPYKPYEFSSEWEVTQFRDEVQRYKRCISDFVDTQRGSRSAPAGCQ
jgi:hypothetical protein